MTSRERLLTVLSGKIPDCVPVAPDTSNMIPAKLTGLPFWDIYLYNKIPLWQAYINCVKHFGFDSLMDGYFDLVLTDEKTGKRYGNWGYDEGCWVEVIIHKDENRIITQCYHKDNPSFWIPSVNIYRRNDPPCSVHPSLMGLPLVPEKWEPVEGITEWPEGEELYNLASGQLGDHGVMGVWCGTSMVLHNEQDIIDYYDDPTPFYKRRDDYIEYFSKRFELITKMKHRPDVICMGGSGSLIFQTPDAFRELALPIIKHMTALAKKHGIPTHIHSCGPEKELIRMIYEETDLTVIDPLELPPMGDCTLKEIKKLYGDKLVLKGNLHTTDTMLCGSVQDVIKASKHAIDDAAYNGKFILSTGDQCGRDTPFENLTAMIETARTYGKYE